MFILKKILVCWLFLICIFLVETHCDFLDIEISTTHKTLNFIVYDGW